MKWTQDDETCNQRLKQLPKFELASYETDQMIERIQSEIRKRKTINKRRRFIFTLSGAASFVAIACLVIFFWQSNYGTFPFNTRNQPTSDPSGRITDNKSNQTNSNTDHDILNASIIKPQGVMSFHMNDAHNGWALTTQSILRTNNGGSSWGDVTPKNVHIPTDSYTSMRMTSLDAKVAWFALPEPQQGKVTVYSTTNGGKQWHESTVQSSFGNDSSPSPTTLYFTDAKHGWMVLSVGVAMGSEPVELYNTSDGGITWNRILQQSMDTGSQSNGLPVNGDKTGLAFIDPMNGWITGISHISGTWLYQTHDGGKTWNSESLKLLPPYNNSEEYADTNQPFFFSEKEGILPVVFHDQGQPTVFYHTNDSGASWIPSKPLVSHSGNSFTWSFVDSKYGFATDQDMMYVTTNGGDSWSSFAPANMKLKNVSNIQFVTTKTGWAIQDQQIISTSDGGHNWSK